MVKNIKHENLNQMIQETHDVLECVNQCMWGAQEMSKFYVDQKEFETTWGYHEGNFESHT